MIKSEMYNVKSNDYFPHAFFFFYDYSLPVTNRPSYLFKPLNSKILSP